MMKKRLLSLLLAFSMILVLPSAVASGIGVNSLTPAQARAYGQVLTEHSNYVDVVALVDLNRDGTLEMLYIGKNGKIDSSEYGMFIYTFQAKEAILAGEIVADSNDPIFCYFDVFIQNSQIYLRETFEYIKSDLYMGHTSNHLVVCTFSGLKLNPVLNLGYTSDRTYITWDEAGNEVTLEPYQEEKAYYLEENGVRQEISEGAAIPLIDEYTKYKGGYDLLSIDATLPSAIWRHEQISGLLSALQARGYETADTASQAAQVSSWAAADITRAKGLDLVTESLGENMTSPITRYQFADLAVNLAEKTLGRTLSPAPENTFSDTSALCVRKASAAGIVTGTGRDSFEPNGLLNRQQLAVMLSRTLDYIEKSGGPSLTASDGNLSGYTDGVQVAEWARAGLSRMLGAKIIQGTSDRTLSPNGVCTIEQAVILVLRTWDQLH